jgi:hypothetical protein
MAALMHNLATTSVVGLTPFSFNPQRKKALDSHKTGDRVWRLSRRKKSLAIDESEFLVFHPATLPTVDN